MNINDQLALAQLRWPDAEIVGSEKIIGHTFKGGLPMFIDFNPRDPEYQEWVKFELKISVEWWPSAWVVGSPNANKEIECQTREEITDAVLEVALEIKNAKS